VFYCSFALFLALDWVAPSALLDDRAEEKISEIGRKLKVLMDGKSSRIGGEGER
jgi:hypothetical protein